MENLTEYTLSTREIERRTHAFTRLLLSFALGVILTSPDMLLALRWMAMPALILLTIILMLVRQVSMKFSHKYARMKLSLSSQGLERAETSAQEQFEFQDISAIQIKRTVTGAIREIMLKRHTGQRVYVNAVRDFEHFKDDLISRTRPDTVVHEFRERIDYDHPLFYIVLGGIVGVITTLALRLMTSLALHQIQTLNAGIALYVAAMGVYWLFSNPIVNRYGNKFRKSDLMWGWGLVGIAVLLGFYTLHLS